MLWADPCCHGNEIWANFSYFSTKSSISRLVCQIDRICLDLPGETTRGPIYVAMAMTFSLGAESNRLPACLYYVSVRPFVHVCNCAKCASVPTCVADC